MVRGSTSQLNASMRSTAIVGESKAIGVNDQANREANSWTEVLLVHAERAEALLNAL